MWGWRVGDDHRALGATIDDRRLGRWLGAETKENLSAERAQDKLSRLRSGVENRGKKKSRVPRSLIGFLVCRAPRWI